MDSDDGSTTSTESDSDSSTGSFRMECGGQGRLDSRGPVANGGLSHFATGDYDKEYWAAAVLENGPYVRLIDIQHNAEYVVPSSRVNKAMRFLQVPQVTGMLRPGSKSCRCKRTPPCCQQLTVSEIITLRHSFFQQSTEREATQWLADYVRPFQVEPTHKSLHCHRKRARSQRKRKFIWKVAGKQVCDEFFMAVFGISRDKLNGVRALLQTSKATLSAPRLRELRPRVKYNQCKGFWHSFFKQNCQRPNKHERLFPANSSYLYIYEDFFTEWYKITFPQFVADMPCMGFFMAARYDASFADVKNRPKHHHCRCGTCANLQARRLKAFNSAQEQAEFVLEWQDHQNEKRNWREFEMLEVTEARHNPRSKNVFWSDDTNSLGISKFTKRPHKNLTSSRFHVIPFLIADLARGKDYYVYTAKGRFKKGANRLCTTLMAAIRATKEGDHEARHARELTLIADNFSENKNNTLFAFCSDLVMRGWYDVIKLVFGPPGHTHNGGDQQHQIHNEVCGNFTSPTFVHFIAKYPQAWRQEHTRPTPCVLDVQYDFDAYYSPFLKKVAGFTSTEYDPAIARGFKFEREAGGIVSMKWKTKAESGAWRGVENNIDGPGFVVLKGRPQGVPNLIEPKTHIMKKSYFKQLTGSRMQECLDAEGAHEAMAWLKKSAKHGVMPIHRRLQAIGEITPGEFGSQVEMKCDQVTAVVQMIEHVDMASEKFWSLPAAVLAVLDQRRLAGEALSAKHLQHPAIGYLAVPREKRPTYPGSSAQAVALANDDKDEVEPVSADSSDSDSDDDVPLAPQLNNARRQPSPPRRARKRRKPAPVVAEEPVDSTEIKLDVLAAFGTGDNGEAEVWLGVKQPCKKKSHFKIQYLSAAVEPGYYTLTSGVDDFKNNNLQHTFASITFDKTTTYELSRSKKRKGKGKVVVRTKESSINAILLADLISKAADWASASE